MTDVAAPPVTATDAPAAVVPAAPAPAPVAAPTPAPVEYKITAPEGFDAAQIPKMVEIAKLYGITPEKAQQLVNDTHANQAKAKATMDAQLAKQREEWHAEIKADKEFGGEKFAPSLARAQKVVGEVDAKIAPGIKTLLDSSGYADHPAVVRLFNYLGRENREDTFSGGSGHQAGEKSLAEAMYPQTPTT